MGRSPPVPPAGLPSNEGSPFESPLSRPSPVRESSPCDYKGFFDQEWRVPSEAPAERWPDTHLKKAGSVPISLIAAV